MRNYCAALIAGLVIGAGIIPSSHAGAISCGDATLGDRQVTVDPALDCTYAGLTNLGDPALVSLLDGLFAPDTFTLLDRDAANGNGGDLDITGVGGISGTWTIDNSVWNYDRAFLYFHFGDGQDIGGVTDPDVFIVELMTGDVTGTWSLGGGNLNGLSNIALLRSNTSSGGTPGSGTVPEPGAVSLLGLGLVGTLFFFRRRRLRNS